MKQQLVVENRQNEAQERELAAKLIKKGLFELKPTLTKRGVRYVEVEETWENPDSNQIQSILRNLEKKGVLQSTFIDRVLTCPDCASPDVYSKYACPRCHSTNVEYTELIEHTKCGHIGSKDKFTKDACLVCPSCHAELKEESANYCIIGDCYQCEKCEYRFDKPEIVHFCQNCNRSFTYQEAKYIKIFAYKITAHTLGDFRKDLPIIEHIEKIFTDKGFQVKLHPQITGISGAEHTFELLAEKKETRVVIDASLTGSKNDMISLLGKKIDVNPTKALLIDLSNSDELIPLEKVYDIPVFKAQSTYSLQDQFQSFLETLRSR